MFADIANPQERLRLLRDNCETSEETRYIKPLTQEELDQRSESIAITCIEIYKLESELKEVKDEYKDKIDPLKLENKQLCNEFHSRQAEIVGRIFHFADHESGMMNTYDETGEFVSARRLKPEEKQARLFIPAVNQ